MPEDRDFKKVSKEGFEGDIEGYFMGSPRVLYGALGGGLQWGLQRELRMGL